MCQEWPNKAVTHECVQRMSELQHTTVFGHEWHIFYNETP
jgi:hypothetical protein